MNNSHAKLLTWGNREQKGSGLRKETSFTSQLLPVPTGIKLAIRGTPGTPIVQQFPFHGIPVLPMHVVCPSSIFLIYKLPWGAYVSST